MKPIVIFADFNNADSKGRVRLNTLGTFDDIKTGNILLSEGLEVIINDGEGLETPGIVEFSMDENIWVAKIDWERLK